MAITVYCTQADVEMLWSQYGVEIRAEDESTDSAPLTVSHITASIEKACADINFWLFQQYQAAVIAASTWVKWCAAVFAAVELARRRGNPIPESFQEEYDAYLEKLKLIAEGGLGLPGDSGLAAPQFDNSPMVTNLRVDSRQRAPIRRNTTTSTDAPQSGSRKGFPQVGTSYPYY